MNLDPESLKPTALYHLLIGVIAPRPIAWVATISPSGVPNLAPFSYFNGAGVLPPMVCFAPINRRDGSKKDTILNLRSTPEFTVSVVTAALAEAMNLTSAEAAREESEFALAGVTPAPSRRVRPPSVAESPVRMECVLHDIIELGTGPLAGNLVIGRIVHFHIEDSLLLPDGSLDESRLDLLARMGGDTYLRSTDRIRITRPGS